MTGAVPLPLYLLQTSSTFGSHLGSIGTTSGTGDANDWRGKASGIFADTAGAAIQLPQLSLVSAVGLTKLGVLPLRFLWNHQGFKNNIVRLNKLNLPIIQAGLAVIQQMELLNGFGSPERGDKLKASLVPSIDTIVAAFPTDSWAGAGAQAYAAVNAKHLEHVEEMARADELLRNILQREASEVEDTRLVLASVKNFLIFVCIPIALYLKSFPGVGETLSISFQLSIVGMAVTGARAAQATMVARSVDNASQLRDLNARYRKIESTAKPSGTSFSLSTEGSGHLIASAPHKVLLPSGPGDVVAATGRDNLIEGTQRAPVSAHLQSSTTVPRFPGWSLEPSGIAELAPPEPAKRSQQVAEELRQRATYPPEADSSAAAEAAGAGRLRNGGRAPVTGGVKSRNEAPAEFSSASSSEKVADEAPSVQPGGVV
ncbi:EspA/EspE family type VII secretion system effector [Mycobacterium sp.]|uniref:EspA/EspE family type VII secretion system effector n=1 Tax=Mycobacterium sp. TaxID=1785 RepID=UPI00257F7AB0|nr:EspA/EspE family type VII secretion system effector [Mycobacterium sp.]